MLKNIFSFLKLATLSFFLFSVIGILFLYLLSVFPNTKNKIEEIELKQNNVINKNVIRSTSINNIETNIVNIKSYKNEILKDIENLRLMLIILNQKDDNITKEINQYENLVLNYNPRNNIDLIALDYLDFKKVLIKRLGEELIIEDKGN